MKLLGSVFLLLLSTNVLAKPAMLLTCEEFPEKDKEQHKFLFVLYEELGTFELIRDKTAHTGILKVERHFYRMLLTESDQELDIVVNRAEKEFHLKKVAVGYRSISENNVETMPGECTKKEYKQLL